MSAHGGTIHRAGQRAGLAGVETRKTSMSAHRGTTLLQRDMAPQEDTCSERRTPKPPDVASARETGRTRTGAREEPRDLLARPLLTLLSASRLFVRKSPRRTRRKCPTRWQGQACEEDRSGRRCSDYAMTAWTQTPSEESEPLDPHPPLRPAARHCDRTGTCSRHRLPHAMDGPRDTGPAGQEFPPSLEVPKQLKKNPQTGPSARQWLETSSTERGLPYKHLQT